MCARTVSSEPCVQHSHLNGHVLLRLDTHHLALTLELLFAHAGCYSPVLLLKAFIQEAGGALATVTALGLHFEDTGDSTSTLAVMRGAMASLLSACPVLTSLRCSDGHLSATFLQQLGVACPLLASLDIDTGPGDEQYLRNLIPQLSTHLRNLTTLVLQGDGFMLPDMSDSTVVSLRLEGFTFASEDQWRGLPSRLRSLCCAHLEQGPAAGSAGDSCSLAALQTLRLTSAPVATLHSLAQLLRAAPALAFIECDRARKDGGLWVKCCLSGKTAADLSLLHCRMNIHVVRHATYWFECADEELLPPGFWSSLPLLPGLTRCDLEGWPPENVSGLLRLFPDLQHLHLTYMVGFDDIVLRQLASCEQLQSLTLDGCVRVTPLGLFALCMQLPGLGLVSYETCVGLAGPELDRCVALLQAYGLSAEWKCQD